jgi:hypothetical protein
LAFKKERHVALGKEEFGERISASRSWGMQMRKYNCIVGAGVQASQQSNATIPV